MYVGGIGGELWLLVRLCKGGKAPASALYAGFLIRSLAKIPFTVLRGSVFGVEAPDAPYMSLLNSVLGESMAGVAPCCPCELCMVSNEDSAECTDSLSEKGTKNTEMSQ